MRLLLPLLLVAVLPGCGDAPVATTSPARAISPAATSQATESEDAPLRLGVLGDSYSNGEAAGAERAWPTVMAGLLTRDGLPTRVASNPSVTGATTAEMLATGLHPIRASHPDVMTVMLGVNDQVQGRTTEEFSADEDRAIAAAIEITGSAGRVIVVDIPDYSVAPAGAQFGDPSAISQQIDAFNEVIRKVAARRRVGFVSIVDLSRRFGADGISADGLHPSAAQLVEWAKRIGAAARKQWATLKSGQR